ncbi:hypothetical protein P43SY_003406 [Pythium insidiosum]|uniref:Uncharacterized protein n=1 Tax=Pythium insidiosum TaxID=114742 RepID=A0AAD5M550_PYTIN|nr:hypothetical protein P43SY_003406 [Pythium insidiosum]
MGNAVATIRNDTRWDVTVRTYNAADTVQWIPYDSYEVNAGVTTRVYAAPATGLRAYVIATLDGHRITAMHWLDSGSTHRVSDLLPTLVVEATLRRYRSLVSAANAAECEDMVDDLMADAERSRRQWWSNLERLTVEQSSEASVQRRQATTRSTVDISEQLDRRHAALMALESAIVEEVEADMLYRAQDEQARAMEREEMARMQQRVLLRS